MIKYDPSVEATKRLLNKFPKEVDALRPNERRQSERRKKDRRTA